MQIQQQQRHNIKDTAINKQDILTNMFDQNTTQIKITIENKINQNRCPFFEKKQNRFHYGGKESSEFKKTWFEAIIKLKLVSRNAKVKKCNLNCKQNAIQTLTTFKLLDEDIQAHKEEIDDKIVPIAIEFHDKFDDDKRSFSKSLNRHRIVK